jgi:hypothetical protein
MRKCGLWAPSALLTRCAHRMRRGGVKHTLMTTCRLVPWEHISANQGSCCRGAHGGIGLVAGAVRLWQGGDALLGLPDTGRGPRHGKDISIVVLTCSLFEKHICV